MYSFVHCRPYHKFHPINMGKYYMQYLTLFSRCTIVQYVTDIKFQMSFNCKSSEYLDLSTVFVSLASFSLNRDAIKRSFIETYGSKRLIVMKKLIA